MNITIKISMIVALFILSGCFSTVFSQEDYTHFSKTFSRDKPYRIFLPEDYNASREKYPVAYFFHGNKGTHRHSLSETMAALAKEQLSPYEIKVENNGKSKTEILHLTRERTLKMKL
jgi:enterochelin esterase-like enzyme